MRADAAIVGMACVFPGAPDPETYWRNIRDGTDSITEVPEDRWDPVFYDPESTSADRVYCNRGGFIDRWARFDATALGVMPASVEGTEPDQLLTLQVATQALADAGYGGGRSPSSSAAVILGRGGYVGVGMNRMIQRVWTAEQLVAALRRAAPGLGEDQLAGVKTAFQEQLGAFGPDSAIGLVPNLAASRIAHRLDLHGPAYTVDAACASALVAVDQACRELESGQVDVALAGGVHVGHDVAFWSVFSQLGALSRDQQIRPFDRRADGLLIGEGVGLVVLKRRVDAERDDDRVYAVIRGTGTASDGRGTSIMTPASPGQRLALERAWQPSELDPGSLGLLEAHGTGTPAGDAAELTTVADFFGADSSAAIGSVKSMIGHTMPAAGAAGLIKAALALYHGVLPPTLHCQEPHPRLAETRFRALTESVDWDLPRRAGINAFGFGGINAHVVLDGADVAGARRRRRPRGASSDDLLVLAAPTREELLDGLAEGRRGGAGPWRIALAASGGERLEKAARIVEAGQPRRGRDGIHFAANGLISGGGKVAYVFPGVEATFEPQVLDVAEYFDLPAPRHLDADDVERRGAAVLEVGRLLNDALARAGFRPDLIAGHSVGEWTGMLAVGMLPEDYIEAFLRDIRPGTLEIPGFVFAAVGCSAELARQATAELPSVNVSHDNCPHQTVICGLEHEVEAALESLRSRRILGQALPYPHGGFHTPLFRDYTESHRRHYASIAFRRADIPLWSATTCAPYPDGADEVRELAVRHLVEPVRFRELIDALYAEGVRLFVQVGAGNLVGFIEDTLSGRPHLTIASNTPRRSGMEQLRIAVAALFVEGADVDLASVGIAARAPTDLPLGVTLASLDLPSDRDTVASPDSRAVTGDPVLDAFEANVRELGSASERVRAAYTVGVGRRPPQRPAAMMASGDPRPPGSDGGLAARKEVLRISVDEFPELVDHSFYRQPDGWPHLVDSHPVVPMTMSIALMADAVRRLEPGREVVSFESVGARRWLVVEPPAEVVIRTSRRGDGAVEVTIEGHVDGLARTAREFPPAPEPDAAPLSGEREPPIEARDLYADRWLFHGPSYAGIGRLEALADDGIRARFVTLPAKGALLDAAGQLFGYWIKAMMPKDRLALPVGVRRIEFYRPDPAPGEELDCTVRVREVGDLLIEADIELTQAGRLYAALAGWVDRRFETDERIWGVMHFPEHNLLAEPRPGGYVVLDDSTYAMPAPDYLARRFLSEIERGELDGLPPRRRREWVRGRVAAKDAVRHLLREEQREPLYPIEVAVSADEDGRPQVAMESGEDIRVSIAHKGSVAVAIAALGRWPGIDLEPVEERDPAFVTRAFGPGELAHLPAPGSEWITRMWCAKEAAGKARRTGLAGAPRELPVTDVVGDDVCVDGTWVRTTREGDLVVAWTSGVNAPPTGRSEAARSAVARRHEPIGPPSRSGVGR